MNQGKESFGRPATGPKRVWPSRHGTKESMAVRTPDQREFWPSRHGTKESYDSGGTPPQRNSAAVMSRGMVMAESSVVTATMRVLNR